MHTPRRGHRQRRRRALLCLRTHVVVLRSSSTYGEITVKGFRSLAGRIGLRQADAFLDLGSGVGRTVVQAALEFGCREARGVEMSSSRHERAQRALDALPQKLGEREELREALSPMHGVALVEGNMLELPIPPATTVCWMASLCFSEDFMEQIATKLASEAPDLRAIGVCMCVCYCALCTDAGLAWHIALICAANAPHQ